MSFENHNRLCSTVTSPHGISTDLLAFTALIKVVLIKVLAIVKEGCIIVLAPGKLYMDVHVKLTLDTSYNVMPLNLNTR